MNRSNEWLQSQPHVFWGEIAPCDHVLQIYEDNGIFLDMLTGFVGGGINAGDSVIVIATAEHLTGLEKRLVAHGIYLDSLIADKQYIPVHADEILSKFIVNGWPDEALFISEITKLIETAGSKNRKVRAFGEMVAILWAQGHSGATVRLEHMWDSLCKKEELSLFCAYPKSGFTKDINDSFNHICGSHSKIITSTKPYTEILYKEIVGE